MHLSRDRVATSRTMEAGGSSLYRFGHGPQWTTRASNFGTTNTSRTSKPSSLVVHQNSCTLWHYDYVASWHCSLHPAAEQLWSGEISKTSCGDVGHNFSPAGMQICKMKMALKDLIYSDYCATSLHRKKEGQIVESCSFVLSCNRKSIRHPKKQK